MTARRLTGSRRERPARKSAKPEPKLIPAPSRVSTATSFNEVAVREGWEEREPERQPRSGLFERAVLSPPQVSPLVRQLHRTRSPTLIGEFYTMLSSKALLRSKLHEFHQALAGPETGTAAANPSRAKGRRR